MLAILWPFLLILLQPNQMILELKYSNKHFSLKLFWISSPQSHVDIKRWTAHSLCWVWACGVHFGSLATSFVLKNQKTWGEATLHHVIIQYRVNKKSVRPWKLDRSHLLPTCKIWYHFLNWGPNYRQIHTQN